MRRPITIEHVVAVERLDRRMRALPPPRPPFTSEDLAVAIEVLHATLGPPGPLVAGLRYDPIRYDQTLEFAVPPLDCDDDDA